MVGFLALWAAKLVKIVALAVATTLSGAATQIAPAADWVTDALTCETSAPSVRSAGPLALSVVPVTHRSHRGAERATVLAISATSSAASVIPVSVKCSTVSPDVWILLEAEPST